MSDHSVTLHAVGIVPAAFLTYFVLLSNIYKEEILEKEIKHLLSLFGTQSELAEILGISQGTISLLIHRKRTASKHLEKLIQITHQQYKDSHARDHLSEAH